MDQTFPLTRNLVFIGGGHSHALVLRKRGMNPLPGASLTLINPGPTAPYTGMLPGYVAGHYKRADLRIDLVRLARFANARLITGAVSGIDLEEKRIHVPGRAPIAYDIASINVGITSDLPNLLGFNDHGTAAKPLGVFARRWTHYRALVETQTASPDIAVIGGGVGGVELAFAMAFSLRQNAPRLTVIDRSTALPGLTARARKALLDRLDALNITLIENAQVVGVEQSAVVLADGRTIPSAFTVGAAGAQPHPWLTGTQLAHTDGFLDVADTLQTSDSAVFAAGDCVALPDPRPKAGVFAVREAPVLFHNLRAAMCDHTARRSYRPQRSYLKLISLGSKSAIADKWGGRLAGPWVWRWKDRIDQKFMDQFKDLPVMQPPALPKIHAADLPEVLGDKPLCGGCGAKVGGTTLAQSIAQLPASTRTDVLSQPGDDAAVLQINGTQQVLTTDHLRSFVLDPWMMTQITAIHALGDIWAMGAAPQAALSSLILPKMSPTLQRHWLDEITTAAHQVFDAAGASIVGGHTTIGAELTVGFTITGLLTRAPITLAGAQPGDALILTKPIGSGTILAAEMQLKARGDWWDNALSVLCQPQGQAAQILSQATAMTDVTGFGLAGHLMNICRASQVGAGLDIAAIPTLEGAIELAEIGIRSTIFEDNHRLAPDVDLPKGAKTDLLFDPQTAGGLLAAVPQASARQFLEDLHNAGYPAAHIGRITAGPARITPVAG